MMVASLALALVASSAATDDASADPVAIASSFIEAVINGNAEQIRAQRTADAMMVLGHIAAPLAGSESALARPQFKTCTAGKLALKPGPVAVAALGNQAPPSIKLATARQVDGTLSCPQTGGGTKILMVSIILADGRVALFNLGV